MLSDLAGGASASFNRFVFQCVAQARGTPSVPQSWDFQVSGFMNDGLCSDRTCQSVTNGVPGSIAFEKHAKLGHREI
jgi:hypothetical protein